MMLFLGLVVFVSLEPVSEVQIVQPEVMINQMVDDAIAAMDNTGFIMRSIEDGNALPIEDKLNGLLPGSIGFRLEMLQYTSNLDDPLSVCRGNQTFDDCFPDPYPDAEANPKTLFGIGDLIPQEAEIFHGRKLFIKKEPGECYIAGGLLGYESDWFALYLQGNQAPEAKDVNITTGGGCPGKVNPCPETTDTMRCCYEYFDADGNPEIDVEFTWYEYDAGAPGDKWVLTTETGQTVPLETADDTNRWKCSASVSDGSLWSPDANSPFAIVGGPCFVFDSGLSPEPVQCGQASTASLTVSAAVGGRETPVDIMLLMDRSGSMSWLDYYDGASGTERSVFADSDTNTAYLGTSSDVYKIDVNVESGGVAYSGLSTGIEDARGLYVDNNYVFVADDFVGLTVLDKNTMGLVRTIGDITTAEGVAGQGTNIYIAANGMTPVTKILDETAKVTGLSEEAGALDENSLDATGGYMNIGDSGSNQIDWGSTKGTISFWVKRDATSDSDRFWGQHNYMEIRYSSGDIALDWGVSSGSSYSTIRISDPVPQTGKWYFIAVVWNQDSDDLYLYVGDEDNQPTERAHNNNWTRNVTSRDVDEINSFMRSGSGYGSPVDGRGEELRYYDIDRSLADIQSDYKQELVGNETDLVSYYRLDGDFTDLGPAGSAASASGSTGWSPETPLGNPAVIDEHSIDATGGYMEVGNGNVDWGSTEGTISFWVKRDTISSSDRYWGQHNDMEIRYSSGNLILDWGYYSGGSSTISVSDPLTETDKWYFVAVAWNESTNQLRLYVGDEDSLPEQFGSNNNWVYSVSDEGIDNGNWFMRSGSGYGEAVDGKGEELRYFDTYRSLSEIQSDYMHELVGNETGLVSYFNLNGDFTDLGPAGDDGSAIGSTQWSEDTPIPQLEGEAHIGKDASESWAAQSFQPSISLITEAFLPLAKTGSPTSDITVHVRSTINGSDLTNGTVVIDDADIPQTLGWVSVDFPGQGISITAGNTYYIAITTTGLDSDNYFVWGTVSHAEDQYSDGTLWECTSANACTARQPANQAEYEDAGFKIYYEGESPGGIVIIDRADTNPSNWHVEGSLHDTGSGGIQGNDIAVSGNYAYVTDNNGDSYDGLWIVDVSDPSNPAYEGFLAIDDAISVAVSGNYAYVIEDDTSLHVVNVQNKSSPSISTSLSTLGDAQDVYVDGTTAYVTANDTGSGATENGVRLVDISDPPNAALSNTFYFPYGTFGRLAVGAKFAYIINTSYGLVTMHKVLGPKINISRAAAEDFILFEDWNAPDDQLGVASYGGSTSTLNSPLLVATFANKLTINTQIGTIMADGGTPMYLGIREALDELEANQGADAVQFVIMLADGQSSQNFDYYVKPEVFPRARDNQVYIFTIGFGGDVDEDQMQWITENAYCPDGFGGDDCGTYHNISDPESLSEIYEIISQDIASLIGLMPDGDKTNIIMEFEQFAGGVGLSNFNPEPGPGNWDGTTLRYLGVNIRSPWTASFDMTIACDYSGCGDDFSSDTNAVFPPENTVIEFSVGDVNQYSVYWPEKFSAEAEFYYNDLTVDFTEGLFYGDDDTTLNYSVSNIGYVDDVDLGQIDPTVEFFRGDSALEACEVPLDSVGSEHLVGRILDAAFGVDAGPSTTTDETVNLSASGYLCIWLNKDQNPIVECSENNREIVHCAIPKTYLYVLDYWSWEK